MPPHPGLLYRLRSTTKYDEHPKEKVYQFVRLISWHFSDASWSSDVKLRRDARICRATSRLVSVAACPESILNSKIKQKNKHSSLPLVEGSAGLQKHQDGCLCSMDSFQWRAGKGKVTQKFTAGGLKTWISPYRWSNHCRRRWVAIAR